MPPQKKELPPEFEQHPSDSNMYRCTVCFAVESRNSSWMKRGSVREHLQTAKHQDNQQLKISREMQEASERNKYRQTYVGSIPLEQPIQHQVHARAQAPNMLFPEPSAFQSLLENSFLPSDDLFLSGVQAGNSAHGTTLDEVDIDILLGEQYQSLLLDALHLDDFGQGGDMDEEVPDFFSGPGLVGEEEDEIDIDSSELQPTSDGVYFPYPNKISMLLDILDNLPRLRLSTHSVKLILWMLKQLGHEVPSFNTFRKMQRNLRIQCASTPKAHVSDFKNHYHSLPLRESIAKDFANPQVAPHINLYPERTDGPRSEAWQFDRWTEFSPSQLTPMFSKGLKQFWIDEVSQLSDGTYVIPRNWIYVRTREHAKRELHSDCSVVTVMPNGWTISADVSTFAASKFLYNYEEVIARVGDQIAWDPLTVQISSVPEMPNPLRKLADGDDLYVVMVPLWCDDVSGNKSKQYNKHINIYSVNGSLPGQLLQQEYFVNFVSTSPHASPLEQFKSLRDEIKETEKNPIRSYNAATGRMCRSVLRVPMLPADNPAQSEESSHIGGNSNHPCRKCKVGGNFKETETAEGYHCFFCDNISIRRSAEDIKDQLQKQMRAAMTGIQTRVTELQTDSGVKDKITEVWIEKLISQAQAYKADKFSEEEIVTKLSNWLDKEPGEKMNPLLDITGLDPSQDTPVEILHTVLLGIMKYVWYMSHISMTDKELELLAVRLQSTDIDGLTVPPIRAAYMVQYRNNLIGKHFKTLMQIMPFHVHNFAKLGHAHFRLVQTIGALGPLLWIPEIDDLDQYLDDIEILVDNVLDAFADVAPSKILVKIKIHLLTHLRSDIQRFGPPIRYATEVFEGFNAVFRLCSIYSNHQAPSRDIALKFSDMGRVKHVLSGGFWPHQELPGQVRWVQASKAVLGLLHEVPIIQRHLGWVPHKPTGTLTGHISFKSRKNALKVPWIESKAALSQQELVPPSEIEWFVGKNPKVIARSGDSCTVGSWVFVEDSKHHQLIGRISEILLRGNSQASHGMVTLDLFELGARIHEDFQCPILRRQTPHISAAVKSTQIKFCFSAQHDCRLAKCQPNRRINVIQERQTTERTQSLLEHSDDDNFIINMFALHNAQLLRQALPRNLWKPVALYSDRQARHAEIAQVLAVDQSKKRAVTQEKTQATKRRRKEGETSMSTLGEDAQSRQKKQKK